MKKICLILPYFGKLHKYFHLWLKSCEYNPTIDFLLLTDDNRHFEYPINVKVVYCTFEDIQKRIKLFFGNTIVLERPYKLCDYKPAYGEIFADYLKGYDFWGHCDCDLIWGDIRSFITDEILEKYDKILTRGHLTIYRNNVVTNQMYRQVVAGIVSYKKVYMSHNPFCYDEWGGVSRIWKILNPQKQYDNIVFDDILYSKYEFISSQKRSTTEEMLKEFIIFKFDKGKLFRIYINKETGNIQSEPSCYVHFQKRDMNVSIDFMYESFLMIPNQFIANEEISCEKLRKWAAPKLFYKKYFQIRWSNLKRSVSNIFIKKCIF